MQAAGWETPCDYKLQCLAVLSTHADDGCEHNQNFCSDHVDLSFNVPIIRKNNITFLNYCSSFP